MILLGLIPKAGALVASIPPPVLGGAAIAMFATVAVVGIQTLSRVDFHDHRNVVIVGTSIGLAMFVTVQPGVAEAVPEWAQIIFGSGITLGSLCAILLNLVFHHVGKNFGPGRRRLPGHGRHPARPGQRDEPRGVRAAPSAALHQGPDLGRGTRLRPAAVHRHPGPAPAFQEALFSADRAEQRDLLSFYPDLGSDAANDETRGEESRARPGPRRADPAERRGPRGVRAPDRRPTGSGSASR